MLLYAIIRGNAREIDMIIDPHRRPTLYVYGKADIDHFVFVTMYAGYVGVCLHGKTKTPNRNDLKLRTVVVMFSLSI